MQACPAARDGVRRSPRLLPSLRNSVALRQARQLLIDVMYLKEALHAVSDRLAERLLQLFFDDERHAAEARAIGVVQRIINDKAALAVHWRHLLEAPEAAPHAGGHHDQNRLLIFHQVPAPFQFLTLFYPNRAGIASAFRIARNAQACNTPISGSVSHLSPQKDRPRPGFRSGTRCILKNYFSALIAACAAASLAMGTRNGLQET